jgi:hypothetical protein
MYTFSAYDFGGAPGAGSVQWTEDSGYLPAMTTTRTVGSVVISIKDFADKVTIGGNPFMLVYVRVAVTNNGSAAVTVPPGGSGPNLIRLTSTSLDTVQPGQTSNNDFVVAVDNFGTGAALPAGSALSSAAPSLDSAYSAMTSYWNGRVAETASFQLPNLTLPNTGNLANPGTALSNAYKAGTIYMLIMQVGEAQFSAANNYAWILNHDVPGELQARFDTGNFRDAQNLLLTARISETTNSRTRALALALAWLASGAPVPRPARPPAFPARWSTRAVACAPTNSPSAPGPDCRWCSGPATAAATRTPPSPPSRGPRTRSARRPPGTAWTSRARPPPATPR